MKTSITSKVTAAPFALALPSPFNAEPKFKVQLPSNRVAFIYDDRRLVRDGNGEQDGWRLVLMHKGVPCKRSRYHDVNGSFFTNPLDVQMALISVAEELKPKVVQTRSSEDLGDD